MGPIVIPGTINHTISPASSLSKGVIYWETWSEMSETSRQSTPPLQVLSPMYLGAFSKFQHLPHKLGLWRKLHSPQSAKCIGANSRLGPCNEGKLLKWMEPWHGQLILD
jgi:hypothetical protein